MITDLCHASLEFIFLIQTFIFSSNLSGVSLKMEQALSLEFLLRMDIILLNRRSEVGMGMIPPRGSWIDDSTSGETVRTFGCSEGRSPPHLPESHPDPPHAFHAQVSGWPQTSLKCRQIGDQHCCFTFSTSRGTLESQSKSLTGIFPFSIPRLYLCSPSNEPGLPTPLV